MNLHEAYNALLTLVREGWLLAPLVQFGQAEHGVLVPHRTLDTPELWRTSEASRADTQL